MSDPVSNRPLAAESVPKLKDFVKFRYNDVRRQWVVLGPERLLQPDETAVEILKKVDGKASIAEIVAVLTKAYNAPQELITKDVLGLLQQLADKGFLYDCRNKKRLAS